VKATENIATLPYQRPDRQIVVRHGAFFHNPAMLNVGKLRAVMDERHTM
jgi:hypothetical protein